ncbi:MAG: polysaccharide biosynthesis tyrosine autokinase [Desulfomonilaceae bacterium]|nr:polysaccharide biosynthesis tyrosine autokinase [Desulfomonilaceae bacterium]
MSDRELEWQRHPTRHLAGDGQMGAPGFREDRYRFASRPLDDPLNDNVQSIRDYLDIVLRHRRLVVLVFLCALVGSIVYALAKTPIFTSSATIELEQQQTDRGGKESMYEDRVYSDYMAYFLTQKEILTSRHLAEAVVDRMDLGNREEFAKSSPSLIGWVRHTVTGWVSDLMGTDDRVPVEDPALAKKNALSNAVLARLSVKPVKKSNLMAVEVEDADPKLAQEMLKTLLDLYFEQNLDNRKKQSLQAAGWLKEEVIKSEDKLREAQAKLVDFTIDHGIVDSADGGLSQVLSVVNKTMEGHVRSQEMLAKIQSLRMRGVSEQGSLLPEGMKDEYIGKLKQELAIMESEYSQMKGVYSSNYPKMKMLEKKIRFLRDRIGEIEQGLVSSALDSAQTEERLLEQSYQSARAEADRVKSLEAQYSLLKKDVDTNTEFHKILLQEYKRTDIRARTISNNVRIVDPPDRPMSPSKPKKTLIVLIGAMLGLMGGLGMAFVLSAMDQTIYTPQEIEERLNVHKLGIVPDVDKLRLIRGSNGTDENIDFVAYRHPKSPMSDAIRNLETSIFLSNVDRAVHSIAVSSASPGEGKTTVAISLATVLASDPKNKIVIVDADLRKPRIHRAFGLSEKKSGLSDLLDGSVTNISKVCHSTNIPRVFCVTAGTMPRDPVSLLRSDDAQRIADLLKERYTYVIYDTPPVLGFADTPLVCRFVDGLIMVARQGLARRDELKEALQVIRSMDDNKLLGVVMNKVSAGWGYGYGYRYGGHYYYRNYKYYSG